MVNMSISFKKQTNEKTKQKSCTCMHLCENENDLFFLRYEKMTFSTS